MKMFDYKDFTQYSKELIDTLKLISDQSVNDLVDYLLDAYKNNTNIFIIGNGGSALNASHLAEDLAKGTSKSLKDYDTKTFRAMSLTDNVGFITATANDDGYEHIFTNQLKTYASPIGDKLICISGSGNSKNIVEAVKWAHNFKMDTFGILGYDGGRVGGMLDNDRKLIVNSWDMGIVESIHSIILHYLITKLYEKVNK